MCFHPTEHKTEFIPHDFQVEMSILTAKNESISNIFRRFLKEA